MEYATYTMYQYGDEGFDDRGFGCVYRNIQTIIAAVTEDPSKVPYIHTLLTAIKGNGVMELDTRDRWIEPVAAAEYLRDEWSITGTNMLIPTDVGPHIMSTDGVAYIGSIYSPGEATLFINEHFKRSCVPVLIDDGIMSYLIAKPITEESVYLIDPHRSERGVCELSSTFFLNRGWMVFVPDT
jgi:hypothetical protein